MIPLLILFLLFTTCHSTNDYDYRQLPSGVAIETVFDSSGNAELDSLLQLVATSKQDTTLARLYYDIADVYYYNQNDFEKAKEYYLKTGALSEQLDWNHGRYIFSAGFTDILNIQGMLDSSIVIHQQTLELAKRENNERQIALTSSNLANCYTQKRWNQTALDYFNVALSILEKQDNKYTLAHLYDGMGITYGYMDMLDEKRMCCEKALDILTDKPDTLLRAWVLSNYSTVLATHNQLDKAEECLLEAQRIYLLHNNRYFLISVYTNLGDLAMQRYELDKMEMYYLNALEIATEFGDVASYCISNRALGYLEEFRGNFGKSEVYANEALKTAITYDMPMEKVKSYILLADLSTARHDFKNYAVYSITANSIQREIISENSRIYAKEMETRYETEKKELKITALEEEKRFMLWLSISGGAVLFLSLASCFFLWRWAVQKKRLAEQQIKQLIQEKQLVATQSVLDGETRERARLARDLHDGLGSLITGAKLQLLEMKQGVKLEYADVERFDRALGLLDDSVSEMRRVAHHLMPDSLSRFGLKPAVTDFCKNLPTVQFAYYGDESRLDPNMEVMLYRSIHELVNNALKHAGATRIMVQIIQEPDRIAFTVQDDGIGFNPSAITEGMGLQNIRTRVEAYNGMLDINSKAGEGTEINGELRINEK